MSIYARINKGVQKNPEGCALVYGNVRFTYLELHHRVQGLADKLVAAGITARSKVVVVVENPLDFTITMLSLLYIDAVVMPVYARTGSEKIRAIVEDYAVNFIIASSNLTNILSGGIKQAVNDEIGMDIVKICDEIDKELERIPLILFTSGTTNKPKAILLSDNNICSNMEAIAGYLKLREEDSILLVKNLCHSSSIIGELFVGLYCGCKIVLFSLLVTTKNMLRIMERHQISVFFAVPTLLKGIMEYRQIKDYALPCLRVINFYGAPMAGGDILKLIDILPGVNLIYSYGLTEASPRVTYIEKKDLIQKPSSSGKPIENVKLKIVQEDGQEAAPNVVGQITVTGPNVMQGYYRDAKKTKETIINGWLRTGDYGFLDEAGFLYVKGRKDNMIISAGKNIYPEEIEGVLSTYPGIVEALVVSRETENKTIELCGYVVLEEASQLNKNELFVYCRNLLENYKIPNSIIEVCKLEKTPSGKIKRKQIS